jgi:hypothetical protein
MNSPNVTEIFPFITFAISELPAFRTAVLILLVGMSADNATGRERYFDSRLEHALTSYSFFPSKDVGTAMWPAISFAHVTAESNIMRRKARLADIDRHVSRRLKSIS